MKKWQKKFNQDPVVPLLESKNFSIKYFTKSDLLSEDIEPIETIWQLPQVKKILTKQQTEGFWKYPGKKVNQYPKHHYLLLQTWKEFRLLVERYEISKNHSAGEAAANFLFSCQTDEGDIRGMIGNQYATYYTGAIMAVLIKAGYVDDSRIELGFKWLLNMRQDDGGWTIPILTHKFDRKTQNRLTGDFAEPVEPDRKKPFSHNWTDMVLRAFAAHPGYRKSKEAYTAGALLKSTFFQPDVYTSYQAPRYWTRFAFWWPSLLTGLESLYLLGFPPDDKDIKAGLLWFIDNQQPDGLWKLESHKEISSKDREERLWLSLSICRLLKSYYP